MGGIPPITLEICQNIALHPIVTKFGVQDVDLARLPAILV